MTSERLSCETAKSSRHFLMVVPGLAESMISPAILLAKTSRVLGDTDMRERSCVLSCFFTQGKVITC